MYTKPEFSASYSHFQLTFGEMQSLLGHLCSRELM